MHAPVCLFVYNRPVHTENTLEALARNEGAEDTELIIFSDAPRISGSAEKDTETKKKVEQVRGIVRRESGAGRFKSVKIIEREENRGLAKSIVSGVTDVVDTYGRVIVLEDDLVPTPFFLRYMNDGLELYKDDSEVASIHAYIYPVQEELPETFFIKGADCWGWATWKDSWSVYDDDAEKLLDAIKKQRRTREFDFNGQYEYTKMLADNIKGKNNSWAIKWYASAFLRDMLTLYPGKSFLQHEGFDESGTHCIETDCYDAEVVTEYTGLKRIPVEEHTEARQKITRYFSSIKKSFARKVREKAGTILGTGSAGRSGRRV